MKTPGQADLQRWSDDVARDPRSLAFLPLARAYRRQGLREAATQLCLRGLEAYPAHVEAHGLLALLYLDAGDTTKAADEWSIVLRVDPDNFDALRGLGFCFLEQDQLSRARQMLERASLQRPSDPAVREALNVLGTRQELRGQEPAGTAAVPTAEAAVTPPPSPVAGEEAVSGSRDRASGAEDPLALFDDLLAAGPLLGALLIDRQGLVLAGRMSASVRGDGAVLGAVLGGVIDEARRTASHLALGEWGGILLEADHALLHLSRAGQEAVVVLAAPRNAPAGWLLRAAAQAAERAEPYMEACA